jgi:hypothetical protein
MTFSLATLTFTASYWLWAIIVLVAALGAIGLYYRRTMPPLRLPVKAPMVALRVIAALALFLALADVLWSAIRVDKNPLAVWVLFDRSASMSQQDGEKDDRYKRASEYLQSRLTNHLQGRARTVTNYFDSHLLDPKEGLSDSLGASTAIGDVFDQLRRRPMEENPPRALVLLSDGANNRGADPAPAAARLGYPVVAVGFGRPGAAEAQIAELQAPDVVFTDKSFDVTADVQGGVTAGAATIRLSTQGHTLDQKAVTLAGPGQRLPVSLSAQLHEPGMHDLRVDILGPDGQLITAAGKTKFVQAMKGKLRVLLVGFQIDWEYSALRRTLSKLDRVELVEYIPGRSGLGVLPTSTEWQGLDIAILLHPTRAQLQDVWAPHLEALSQSGHGVVFLLDGRFAEGTQTPPTPLEFVHRILSNIQGDYLPEPVATRQNHPLVRLNPSNSWEETRQQWTNRPPWSAIVRFDTLPPDADVLVHAGLSGGDIPAVWTRPLRHGRAIVLTGSSMWRWALEDAAQGQAPAEYTAFWSNALRWLTLTDDADRLAIRSDLDVYHAGEPIVLDGLVYDEAYRFIDRAEVTARIWPEQGGDTVRLVLNPGAGDRFRGQVSALPPGTYGYDGTAKVEAQDLKLSGGMFSIEPYGLEQRYSSLDEGTLRSIADESGGRYYTEAEAASFLDSLDYTPITHERTVEVNLGNHWLVLSIFVAALSLEWFIRRRKQLL